MQEYHNIYNLKINIGIHNLIIYRKRKNEKRGYIQMRYECVIYVA